MHSNATSVILTTYLTGMRDPQRSDAVPVDDPDRLQIVPGCRRLGLPLVVFHDQLSEGFVNRESNEFVSFVRVTTDTSQSVNDQRFLFFRDWLSRNVFENVFCSDGFDVRVNRNPFELVDDSADLWVGVHRDWTIDDSTSDGRYVSRMMRHFYGEVPESVHGKPILMAGTWGGRYQHVLRSLVMLVNEIDAIHIDKPGENCNLAAFNRMAYGEIGGDRIWKNGAPLHSVFRAFDFEADVCFVHK